MTRSIRAPKRTKSEPSGWQSMSPDMPRDCHGCGNPIRISRGGPHWFECGPVLRSWHWECKKRAAE